MIQPIAVNSEKILSTDIFWMLAYAFVLIPLTFIGKKFEFGRTKGLFLFVGYIVFIYMTFI